MSDIFSPERRSEIMSKISGKDTKPEILVRKFLFAQGLRFRKNDKRFPGKPDIVLPKYKTVVFIHGCFWHGHFNCRKSKLPETRKEFWEIKINSNIERDNRDLQKLKELGWQTIIVWQCELSSKKRIDSLNRLLNDIKNFGIGN